MLQASNAIELLNKIELESLYSKVILQLNKDFQLANLNESLDDKILPVELIETLSAMLLKLISNSYDDYLNFLYRVDVSEKELLKIQGKELPAIINQVTFVVLKRECQKVWLKKNFENLSS